MSFCVPSVVGATRPHSAPAAGRTRCRRRGCTEAEAHRPQPPAIQSFLEYNVVEKPQPERDTVSARTTPVQARDERRTFTRNEHNRAPRNRRYDLRWARGSSLARSGRPRPRQCRPIREPEQRRSANRQRLKHDGSYSAGLRSPAPPCHGRCQARADRPSGTRGKSRPDRALARSRPAFGDLQEGRRDLGVPSQRTASSPRFWCGDLPGRAHR